MKLTKSKIKQLIKEELQNILQEQGVDPPGGVTTGVGYPGQEETPPETAPVPAGEEQIVRRPWPMKASLTGAPQGGPATAALQQKILDMLWSINGNL